MYNHAKLGVSIWAERAINAATVKRRPFRKFYNIFLGTQRIVEGFHDGKRIRSLECSCQKLGTCPWIRSKFEMSSSFSPMANAIRSAVLRMAPVSAHN